MPELWQLNLDSAGATKSREGDRLKKIHPADPYCVLDQKIRALVLSFRLEALTGFTLPAERNDYCGVCFPVSLSSFITSPLCITKMTRFS
jgi:hypothetical protein